jgi:hypothetical protein
VLQGVKLHFDGPYSEIPRTRVMKFNKSFLEQDEGDTHEN